MSRIAKTDVNHLPRGREERAGHRPRVDNRDFRTGATVTKTDLKRAVAYAKEHMVAK